ncbi:MAG: hypothetical protein ABIP27_09395 [Flavobacterium circumlabens]|uniref:hypothetical protein n=1 Tax=Flavobacterium circumlabens TaxID=2133765 RepID=UPI003266E1FC
MILQKRCLKSFLGFDFGFDTTGRNEVINSILSGLRSHCTCSIVGVAKLPLQLEMNAFVARALQIKGM